MWRSEPGADPDHRAARGACARRKSARRPEAGTAHTARRHAGRSDDLGGRATRASARRRQSRPWPGRPGGRRARAPARPVVADQDERLHDLVEIAADRLGSALRRSAADVELLEPRLRARRARKTATRSTGSGQGIGDSRGRRVSRRTGSAASAHAAVGRVPVVGRREQPLLDAHLPTQRTPSTA